MVVILFRAGEDYELEMVADVDLTYEQLRVFIDSLLVESGYYNSQQSPAPTQSKPSELES